MADGQQVSAPTGVDLLLRRLLQLGIADFLLISAFDIHRWRRDNWQEFDEMFRIAARMVFDQPAQPVWLYAFAFPFVAINFGCMVQWLRGKRAPIMLPLFVIGAQGDGQLVNYRFRAPYYIVDRLFGAAELRLGGDKGDVVRIERTDGVSGGTRRK